MHLRYTVYALGASLLPPNIPSASGKGGDGDMDTTKDVSRVRRNAKILVYTVSFVVLVQIAISLVVAANTLNKVRDERQDEMERAFQNYKELP